MEYLFLILVFVFVIFIAIKFASRWVGLSIIRKIRGGSDDIICDKTNQYIDKFLTERYTSDLAILIDDASEDIEYDINDINEKTIKSAKNKDLLVAKLLLDTLTHYYIYNKSPNSISRECTDSNIKVLLKSPSGCFGESRINKVIETCQSNIKSNKSDERKSEYVSQREMFRKLKLTQLTSKEQVKSTDDVHTELTKKNIEIRDLKSELERTKLELAVKSSSSTSGISKMSAELYLEDCQRERRLLQDKVYELKREIETLRRTSSGGISSTDVQGLRDQINQLYQQNAQLQQRLANTHNNCVQEQQQIQDLMRQKRECENLLNEVLNAQ